MNLLIIDDDSSIQKVLSTLLSNEYHIVQAYSCNQALELLQTSVIDFVLLDIQLQDGDGFEFISTIKQIKEIPVIFISVLDDEESIVKGLEAGGDDYITKPFSTKVLKARISNIVKRRQINKTLQIDDLYIDLETRSIYKNKQKIHLTNKEEQILFMLVEAKGRVITRNHILNTIWDEKEDYIEDNTLSVTIRRLKNKIGKEYIQTKRNVGYYFKVNENEK